MRWVSSPKRMAPAIRADPFKVWSARCRACEASVWSGLSRQARNWVPMKGINSCASSKNTGSSCWSTSSLMLLSISIASGFSRIGTTLKVGWIGALGAGGVGGSASLVSLSVGMTIETSSTVSLDSISGSMLTWISIAANSARSRALRASATICLR